MKWDKEEGEVDPESGAESSLSPSEAAGEGEDNANKVDPLKWTVSFHFHSFQIFTSLGSKESGLCSSEITNIRIRIRDATNKICIYILRRKF